MSKSDETFQLQQLQDKLKKAVSTGSIYAYVYAYCNLQQQQQNYQLRPHYRSPTDQSMMEYSQFTSFLINDESFLTPWSWKVDDQSDEELNNEEKKTMVFQQGSFFTYDVDSYGFQRRLLQFLMRGKSN
uniref:Uncharacterized protein n=1 Tax=Manihot esculenta TaxID=3983 RepID=A0A2C9VZ33_MANES